MDSEFRGRSTRHSKGHEALDPEVVMRVHAFQFPVPFRDIGSHYEAMAGLIDSMKVIVAAERAERYRNDALHSTGGEGVAEAVQMTSQGDVVSL